MFATYVSEFLLTPTLRLSFRSSWNSMLVLDSLIYLDHLLSRTRSATRRYSGAKPYEIGGYAELRLGQHADKFSLRCLDA